MSYYDRDKTDAQPKMQWPKPHFGSVAEYQVSPWPFCTTAIAPTGGNAGTEVDFGAVTRWIVITSTAGAVNVSFANPDEDGVADPDMVTYFTVPAGTMSRRLEVKCTKIWVSAACTVVAGVTSVGTEQFPDISDRAGITHSP